MTKMTQSQKEKMVAARKAKRALYAVFEIGAITITEYENGWRLELPTKQSPKYYAHLHQCLNGRYLTEYLELHVTDEERALIEDLRARFPKAA